MLQSLALYIKGLLKGVNIIIQVVIWKSFVRSFLLLATWKITISLLILICLYVNYWDKKKYKKWVQAKTKIIRCYKQDCLVTVYQENICATELTSLCWWNPCILHSDVNELPFSSLFQPKIIKTGCIYLMCLEDWKEIYLYEA